MQGAAGRHGRVVRRRARENRFPRRACVLPTFHDTSAAVKPDPQSRPFLRLFSAMQPEHPESSAGERPGDRPRTVPEGHVRRQLDVISGTAEPQRVEVSLGEIAPVIADAVAHRRGWLNDFADDTVSIDADLYEVLLAYRKMRRPAAA